MDRQLSQKTVLKRKRKRIVQIIIPIALFGAIMFIIPSFVRSSVHTSMFKVSTVDSGSVETSFLTYGNIEPFYQQIMTSPIHTDVLRLNYMPGDTVTPQDTLLLLDITELLSRKSKITNELKLAQNKAKRKIEEIKQEKSKLKTSLISDSLKVIRLRSVYEMENKLLGLGGGIKENVEQASLEYQLQKLKLAEIKRELGAFDKLTALDLEAIELEVEQQMQQLTEIETLISKAHIRPKIKGVITVINVKAGQSITEGEQVAIVADLSTYKVNGSISNNYANKLFSGQSAKIFINKNEMTGRVMSISPETANGSIAFDIALSNQKSKLLKPKVKVEIQLIESISANTLRIKNADFYNGAGYTDVFIIDGDALVKQRVKLGGCSYEYIEVLEGLQEGDQVVINQSFYKKYANHNTLKIKR